jgi:Flp pilus assembly protein TadG
MNQAFRSLMRRLRRRIGGNAAMLVAVGMPALIGGSGLAVDVSQWYIWKRELQFAVDQAAVAGAWARADAATQSTYSTRAGQEYTNNLQLTKAFASNPNISLVNYNGGTGNAVQVVATAQRALPFTSILTDWAVTVKVSAKATMQAGGTYSGCIVALHPSAEGAFTLGGNASGNVTCGVAALSNDADAAMVKNGNSSAQLGQLVATGGIDADFAVNGTMHPFTAGLTNPLAGISQPNPSPSPARTYSCPVASAGVTTTTATRTVSTVISYVYVLGNNSNQALSNAQSNTTTTYTPVTTGSSTPGTPQVGITVPNGTVAGTVPATSYSYVRQVRNNPKTQEVKKTVVTTVTSNVVVNTLGASDGIARPQPGTYGTINVACTTDFQPGIYVVDDIDFGQNRVVTGNDVLFVIKNAGGMKINSQSNITLSGISKDRLMTVYNYSEADASKLASMVIYDQCSPSAPMAQIWGCDLRRIWVSS